MSSYLAGKLKAKRIESSISQKCCDKEILVNLVGVLLELASSPYSSIFYDTNASY